MSRLDQRVSALEAAQPTAPPDSQHSAALSAAVNALLDASESGPSWNKRQSGCDFLLALQDRLNTGRDTAADRAMMDALPKCHLPPCTLVWALCELMSDRPGRSVNSARA